MHLIAFLALIAEHRQAKAIVGRFANDPRLGLFARRRFLSASRHDALGPPNRKSVEGLAARMSAPIREDDFDFSEGATLLAPPQVLAPLRRLIFAANAFAPEASQVDGALERTVERLFNRAARAAGFRVRSVSVDDERARAGGGLPSEPDSSNAAGVDACRALWRIHALDLRSNPAFDPCEVRE